MRCCCCSRALRCVWLCGRARADLLRDAVLPTGPEVLLQARVLVGRAEMGLVALVQAAVLSTRCGAASFLLRGPGSTAGGAQPCSKVVPRRFIRAAVQRPAVTHVAVTEVVNDVGGCCSRRLSSSPAALIARIGAHGRVRLLFRGASSLPDTRAGAQLWGGCAVPWDGRRAGGGQRLRARSVGRCLARWRSVVGVCTLRDVR